MGDMADYYLDSVFEGDDSEYEVAGMSCKYCKCGPFWWLADDLGNWRLVTRNGKLHSCKQHKFGDD